MENKKSIKATIFIFLLTFAVIALIIMSYFLYTFYNEKIAESKKANELTSEVNNLQTTISNLENKLNTISNTINSDNNNNTTVNNSNNSTTSEIDKKTKNNTNNKRIKYEFTSADNAAVRGYPRILKIYELTENEMSFEYNSGYDFSTSAINRNITGSALKNNEQLYVYEENISGHKYQLTFKFNDNKDTVKVSEYDNDNELGEIGLFR